MKVINKDLIVSKYNFAIPMVTFLLFSLCTRNGKLYLEIGGINGVGKTASMPNV
jgi:hypothetical protein